MKRNRKFSHLYGAMARFGVTVEELAQRMGKSKTYVQHRLSGEIPWSIADCYKILRMFGEDPSLIQVWFPENEVAA